jgi:hypothetical protein
VTGNEATLLQPAVNEYDALTRIGKIAQGRVLLDRGDHVEWRDGTQTQRWTLPDQPRQGETPIMTSLIVADTWFKTWRIDAPERYVLLADEAGRAMTVLALITTAAGPTYEQVDFDRLWPVGSFDQLHTRGVNRVEESYSDLGALNRAHPGTVARWRLLVGTRTSQWVVAGLFALAFLAVRVVKA